MKKFTIDITQRGYDPRMKVAQGCTPCSRNSIPMKRTLIQTIVEGLFSEQERAIIWAALRTYDVGPKEFNPKLYEELEEIRKELEEAFET